jgi:hypothetical protein
MNKVCSNANHLEQKRVATIKDTVDYLLINQKYCISNVTATKVKEIKFDSGGNLTAASRGVSDRNY